MLLLHNVARTVIEVTFVEQLIHFQFFLNLVFHCVCFDLFVVAITCVYFDPSVHVYITGYLEFRYLLLNFVEPFAFYKGNLK